jgi:hypothetical protein
LDFKWVSVKYVIGNDGIDCSIQSGGTSFYKDLPEMLLPKNRTGEHLGSTRQANVFKCRHRRPPWGSTTPILEARLLWGPIKTTRATSAPS